MKKALLLVVAGLVLSGCSLFLQTPKKSSSTTAPTQTSAQTLAQGKVTTVSAANFSYDKPEIRVKKGEKLTIRFTNTRGQHNLIVEGLNVQTDILGEGDSQDVVVPTDTVGTFSYFCSVGNHRQLGMEGKLIIE